MKDLQEELRNLSDGLAQKADGAAVQSVSSNIKLLHMCRVGFDLLGLLMIRRFSLLALFGQEEDMLNIQFSMAELQNRCVDQGVTASDSATVSFTV